MQQMAIRKYKTDISTLSKKCDEMKKLYSDLLVIIIINVFVLCFSAGINSLQFQEGPFLFFSFQLIPVLSPPRT